MARHTALGDKRHRLRTRICIRKSRGQGAQALLTAAFATLQRSACADLGADNGDGADKQSTAKRPIRAPTRSVTPLCSAPSSLTEPPWQTSKPTRPNRGDVTSVTEEGRRHNVLVQQIPHGQRRLAAMRSHLERSIAEARGPEPERRVTREANALTRSPKDVALNSPIVVLIMPSLNGVDTGRHAPHPYSDITVLSDRLAVIGATLLQEIPLMADCNEHVTLIIPDAVHQNLDNSRGTIGQGCRS